MYSGSTPAACARSPAASTPQAASAGTMIGDQTPVTGGVLTGDDGHLADLLMGGEYGFDLAGFDPETADLDLFVGASQVFQPAVAVPAGHIPGPVHPLTRSAAERAGHKPLRGQPRTPQIPPRQLGTGEVQLARDTDGHRPQPLVQDVDPGVPHRAADRHDPRLAPVLGAEEVVGAAHGGLGRPVVVDHRHTRMPSAPLLYLRVVDRLTAHHHPPGRRAVARQRPHEGQMARSGLEEREPFRAHHRGQVLVQTPPHGPGHRR